jgi:hypothetical protein
MRRCNTPTFYDIGEKGMRIARILFAIITVVPFFDFGVCQGQQDSPVDVVQSFSACYGGPCMDATADQTTGRFRDNKPKSVWVADTWKALQHTAYRKVQDRIVGSEATDNRAAVVVEARIRTVAGETEQKEIYYLIKEGQKWLIDELQVTDEAVEPDGEKVQM